MKRRSLVVWILPLLLLVVGCSSTGSTQPDEAIQSQATSLEDRMADEVLRRHPGVRVYRDEGGLHIRIRGSLGAPLYVVDGLPLAPTPTGALWGISPHDIEAIEVIKDPARLSYYGMRGASGVVLITTKRR